MNKAGLQATTWCFFTSSVVIVAAGLIRLLLHQEGVLHLQYGGALALIGAILKGSERNSSAWNDDKDSLLSFIIALTGWFIALGGVWALFWGTFAGAVGWAWWSSTLLQGALRIITGVAIVRIGRWFAGGES